MPNMNMNNRKSPVKQQRIKHSHSIPVTNSNNGRMRSNSSMASSYPRMYNNNNNNNHYYHYHHYSNTTSPTAMSASSLPAVPLFYSNTYADPPECSSLPKPPESWYLPLSNVDNLPVKIEEEKEKEKEIEKEKENVNVNVNEKEKELITTPIKQKSFISPIQQSKQNFSRTCYYTNNNQGFYSPYYSSTTTSSYQKFPTQYISVKA
ncbi:unnamed protein product [Rotaria sp. Silwood2]|nr:unnamed protein product [Rotaria sp. Silwood2]CAF2510070.1 unnamed protein product [Rotaria sp. Silwood2]CAF2715339.1 unnamed protein product [Rotaria sp. Silwood2]CAF2883559.1 unnamed protein product [Rotaria sp. Silwood2]CAF3849359.1 unnamed protein product [Rotaria sp. Silwood2]